MADVNKTVQVDVRASLKDILAKFKSLPGLTEKEAKEMAKGFARQLRQTERAAKKAAQTNKKAMKQMGASFDQAKVKAKSLRTQARVSNELLWKPLKEDANKITRIIAKELTNVIK